MANIEIDSPYRPETKPRSRYYFKPPQPVDERTTLKLKSRVSNGRQIFTIGGNGRSAWTRRWKDICERHCSDLGGDSNLSEAQLSMVRRAAAMEVQLESMEARMSAGDLAADLALYGRLSGELRRLFETIGVHRIARDVGGSEIETYFKPRHHELQPINGRKYFAFTDASDSFTLGIAHREDNFAILDAIREVRPPFSHQNVVAEFAAVCKSYGCFEVSGDDYSGDQRLFQQLCGLERTVARAGRETVCKSAGNHDDVANSSAGSLCLAALQPAAMVFAVPIVSERLRGLTSPGLPPVVMDPGQFENPLCRTGPEYQTGGGDFAQFWWPGKQ